MQPVVPALPGGTQRLVEPLQCRQPHLLLHLDVVDPRVPRRRELALRHPPQSPGELGAHLVPVRDCLDPGIPGCSQLALRHLHERAKKLAATILHLDYNFYPVIPSRNGRSFHPERSCSTQSLVGAGPLIQPLPPSIPGASEGFVAPFQGCTPHILLHHHVLEPLIPGSDHSSLGQPHQSTAQLQSHCLSCMHKGDPRKKRRHDGFISPSCHRHGHLLLKHGLSAPHTQ